MLDIEEINNTIEELENGNTTYDTCIKLSALYNVRDRLVGHDMSNETERELSDILPQYRLYCEVKRKYQLNELSENSVILAMQDVCKEIKEFIHTLYSSTDMNEEREELKTMLSDLHNALNNVSTI